MNFPSLRSVISAVVKPGLRALQCLYDHQVKYMVGRLTKQDEVIRALQTQVAELNTNVINLIEQNIQLSAQCQVLKENLYSSQAVAVLDERVGNLNIITEAVYAKVLELIITGRVADPTFPDINNVSKNHVYTQEELISYWKISNGMKPDDALSDAQRLALAAYLNAYAAAHPSGS